MNDIIIFLYIIAIIYFLFLKKPKYAKRFIYLYFSVLVLISLLILPIDELYSLIFIKISLFNNNIYIILLYIFILLACAIIIFIKEYGIYYLQEKHLLKNTTIIPIYQPPSNIHPAIAGYLTDKSIGKREFYATIFHLLIKGHLAIDEKIERGRFKYYLIKNKGFDAIDTCDRLISDCIFNFKNNNVDVFPLKNIIIDTEKLSNFILDQLKRLYYLKYEYNISKHFIHWCELKKIDIRLILFRYENRKYFSRKEAENISTQLKRSVDAYRNDYKGQSISLISKTNSIIGPQYKNSLFSKKENVIFRSQYTKLGAEERAKWLGFKDYLQTAERFRMDEEKVETFSKYLPYAVALGVETKWAKRFDNIKIDRLKWFRTQKEGEIIRHEDHKVYFKHLINFLGQIYVK
ncbi:MAG: DUF2207 domain-containing protein [Patescibacteria group bacterium]|nr:DUF2207 domain-containing protein [Patescibacteria group bacterium]